MFWIGNFTLVKCLLFIFPCCFNIFRSFSVFCIVFLLPEFFILSLPFDRFSHISSFCYCFVEIITDTDIIFGHGLLIDYYLGIIVDIGNTADFIT